MISRKTSFALSYLHNRGRLLNLRKPRDLSARWIGRCLSGEVDEIAWLADKYAVRRYVAERCGEDLLVRSLGVWTSADDIPFAQLPERFALKATWGAGMNLVCTDKSKLDVEAARSRIAGWLDSPQEYSRCEQHYNLIPHRVCGEEFIEDQSGGFPLDYKFICLKGNPVCVLACFGRETGHATYMPMTLDWEARPDWSKSGKAYDIPRPKNLENMIRIAGQLAEGIDMVRVDLYDTGDKVLFGEMTLTPAGCIFHRWTNKALEELEQIYRNS